MPDNENGSGTGQTKVNPGVFDYDPSVRSSARAKPGKRRSLEQLYAAAKDLGIHGPSDMNKQELAREVDRKRRQ